jgi:hypothetical protein
MPPPYPTFEQMFPLDPGRAFPSLVPTLQKLTTTR